MQLLTPSYFDILKEIDNSNERQGTNKLIDQAEIEVKSGDGGRGGSVYAQADRNINTLVDFRFARTHRAKNGESGRGSDCYGKGADDVVLRMPVGTVITDINSGEVIAGTVGSVFGVGLTFAMAYIVGYIEPSFVTSIIWSDIIMVFGITLLMILFSAFIPIRRIAGIDPAIVFKT